MLVNCSNQPSAKWPAEQLAVANEKWGSVVDYVFPSVDPEATMGEIARMADKIAAEINDKLWKILGQPQCNGVLVQGEMMLTLVIVQRLQKYGWDVYAAITKRVVEDWPDGWAVDVIPIGHKFVRFRQYPSLYIQSCSEQKRKEEKVADAKDCYEVMSTILKKVRGVDGCQIAPKGGFYIYSKWHQKLSYCDMEKTLKNIEAGVAAVTGHELNRNNIVFCPEPDGEGIFVRWWVEF